MLEHTLCIIVYTLILYCIVLYCIVLYCIIQVQIQALFLCHQMQDQYQKQQFAATLIKNIEYLNKDITLRQVNQFLRSNQQFSPRQTVRKTSGDSFVSFVQLTGYIQIDKAYFQMLIGVTLGYPRTPPFFLISLDRNIFSITDEQKLLQFHYIALQKNERGQDFVRLRYPPIEKQWNPNKMTLNSAYMSVIQIINRPPLLQQKYDMNITSQARIRAQQYNNYQQPPQTNLNLKRLNSKQVTEIVDKMHTDISEVILAKQTIEESNQAYDYGQCREIFLRQHLKSLKVKLTNTRMNVESETQKINGQLREIERSGNCDNLFEMSQQDKNKLNIITQMQVLKQAEVKLRTKLQKQSGAKFSDYKKIMKILYDKMFDNQTNMLKSLK